MKQDRESETANWEQRLRNLENDRRWHDVAELRERIKVLEIKVKTNRDINDTFTFFDASESQDKPDNDPEMGITAVNMIEADRGSSIKAFTGSANSQETYEEWIQKFEDGIESSDITEEEKIIKKLKFKLEGPARRFFETIPAAQQASLVAVKNALKQQYQNNWHIDVAKEKLATCFQTHNESVGAFAERLQKTVRAAYADKNENDIKERTFEHFKEKVLPHNQLYIKLRTCTTMQEAEKAATELQNFRQVMQMKAEGTTETDGLINQLTGLDMHEPQANYLNARASNSRTSRIERTSRHRERNGRSPYRYQSRSNSRSRGYYRSNSRERRSNSREYARERYPYRTPSREYRSPIRDRGRSREYRSREREYSRERRYSRSPRRTVRFERRRNSPYPQTNLVEKPNEELNKKLAEKEKEIESLKQIIRANRNAKQINSIEGLKQDQFFRENEY